MRASMGARNLTTSSWMAPEVHMLRFAVGSSKSSRDPGVPARIARQPRRRINRASRFQLEVLDDRIVPTTFTVTNPGDGLGSIAAEIKAALVRTGQHRQLRPVHHQGHLGEHEHRE